MFFPILSIIKGEHIKYDRDTYYWIMFFTTFYVVHLIITTQNKNFISMYLLVLGLLVFNVYKTTTEKYVKNEYSIDDFLDLIIKDTRHNDLINGDKESKYMFAKALLKSDNVMLSWLQKFKRLGEYQLESYQMITMNIIRFYQSYGIMLRLEKKVAERKITLQDLIAMRQNIMNLIHQFGIQVVSKKSINKEVEQFGLVVLGSLNRCLKVIRNKYQMFESYAPFPQNVLGDVYELY